MTTDPHLPQACVQFADPTIPGGMEVSNTGFLRECRRSALARFQRRRHGRLGCRTIEHRVPPKPGCQESTGMIVAHLSPEVCAAWETSVEGSLGERRAHVEAQVHLALADLADQDMHGYLPLSESQCRIFRPDLVQLVSESLDRTTFSHLGCKADPQWEGTLVERVRPPYLVLDVSIDLAGPEGAAPAPRSAARSAHDPSDW